MSLFHKLLYRSLGLYDRNSYDLIPPNTFDNLQPSHIYSFVESQHEGPSPSVAMTVDDDTGRLAVANDIGDVLLLNTDRNLSEQCKFRAHHCAVFDLKFRPNMGDKQIVTASGDKNIILWDYQRHTRVHELFRTHEGSVKSIDFQDTNFFASSGRDGCIKMWDVRVASQVGAVQFRIDNPHMNTLPSVRSSRSQTNEQNLSFVRSIRSQHRNNSAPTAAARQMANNCKASNVVTCVHFDPNFPYHLYSTGISDNTIKIWDVRKVSRQFRCSQVPFPVKYHSIRNSSSVSSNGHGFSTIVFGHNPRYGNVIYASATDNKIYAFVKGITHPVLVLGGRYSNHFSKLATYGQEYLLSGSITGNVMLWRTNIDRLPMPDEHDQVLIEQRMPNHILRISSSNIADVSLVATNFKRTKAIYTSGEANQIYRWSLTEHSYDKNFDEMQSVNPDFQRNEVPKCLRFEEPQLENVPSSTYKFQVLKLNTGKRPLTPLSQTLTLSHTLTSSSVGVKPLSSITNWLTPESSTSSSSSSSNSDNTHKRPRVPVKRRTSSRQLFCKNRKISEFFTP